MAKPADKRVDTTEQEPVAVPIVVTGTGPLPLCAKTSLPIQVTTFDGDHTDLRTGMAGSMYPGIRLVYTGDIEDSR